MKPAFVLTVGTAGWCVGRLDAAHPEAVGLELSTASAATRELLRGTGQGRAGRRWPALQSPADTCGLRWPSMPHRHSMSLRVARRAQGSMGLILRHHLWEGGEARMRKGAGRPGRSGRLVAVLPSPRAETPAGHTRTCLPCVLVRDTLLGALPPSSARL